MKRHKKPVVDPTKQKLKSIITSLSNDWRPDERETSVLYDHHDKKVHLETSSPSTARRWFTMLWGDPNVKWDTKVSTLKLTVPWDYCRQSDLVLKAKKRAFNA